MARIIIFGGHGKIALLTERLLTDRGDHVTAVIRNPDHAAEVTEAGGTPRVVDLERAEIGELAELIAGHDAVVWSAGAGGGDTARTRSVDQEAAIRTMDAAVQAGVTRYIMVSYFDAATDHGVPADHTFYAYAEAKALADEHLRESDLDWTILGPSALTLDPATGRIDASAASSAQVSRGNVAHVIAEVVRPGSSTNRRTIRFNDGETEIAEALRG